MTIATKSPIFLWHFFSMIERYDKPRPLLSGANFIYRFLPYSEAGHKQWWIIMIKLQYAAYSHADRLILWCLRKKKSSRNQICQHSNHGQIWLVTNIVCLWYFIAQTNNGAFVQLCKYFELTKRLNFLSIFPTLGITFTIGCWLHGSIKESNITLKFILTN